MEIQDMIFPENLETIEQLLEQETKRRQDKTFSFSSTTVTPNGFYTTYTKWSACELCLCPKAWDVIDCDCWCHKRGSHGAAA